MPSRINILCLFTLILCCPLIGISQEEHSHSVATKPESEIHLSTALQEALTEEMFAIQDAMMELIPLMSAGELPQVAKLAKKIEGSFIMKQKLSAEQLEELHQKLPPDFLERDQSFHRMAGMLAHVAEEGHVELVNFYFYKLNEGCSSCHSKYAKSRFPALAGGSTQHEHKH